MESAFVVAMDGPSGSGKSSTARGVAQRLGFAYLDTGAMYRAMTWAMLRKGTDLEDPETIAADAAPVHFASGTNPSTPTIAVDGIDVTEPIRSDEVTSAVSAVAACPAVREKLVALQRAIIESSHGIVVEGRDIGSVVAPKAPIKIFLVADSDARATRRAVENGQADAGTTKAALAARDHLDSTRTASPLARPDGAIEIDSTFLSLAEVIDTVVELVEKAR